MVVSRIAAIAVLCVSVSASAVGESVDRCLPEQGKLTAAKIEQAHALLRSRAYSLGALQQLTAVDSNGYSKKYAQIQVRLTETGDDRTNTVVYSANAVDLRPMVVALIKQHVASVECDLRRLNVSVE